MQRSRTENHARFWRQTYFYILLVQLILSALTYATESRDFFIVGFILFTFVVSAYHYAYIAPMIHLAPRPFWFPATLHEAFSLCVYLGIAILHGALYVYFLFP